MVNVWLGLKPPKKHLVMVRKKIMFVLKNVALLAKSMLEIRDVSVKHNCFCDTILAGNTVMFLLKTPAFCGNIPTGKTATGY